MQIYTAQIRNNTNKTKMLKSHSPNVKQCQCFNFTKFSRNFITSKLADWVGCQLCLQSCHISHLLSVIETSVGDSGDYFVTFASCYTLEIFHDLLNAI